MECRQKLMEKLKKEAGRTLLESCGIYRYHLLAWNTKNDETRKMSPLELASKFENLLKKENKNESARLPICVKLLTEGINP